MRQFNIITGVLKMSAKWKRMIVVLGLTLLANSAIKAAVICEKQGRYWYPKNDTAKMIAKNLGVKTCNGKRFKKVVAAIGEKSNVIAARKNLSVADVVKMFKSN